MGLAFSSVLLGQWAAVVEYFGFSSCCKLPSKCQWALLTDKHSLRSVLHLNIFIPCIARSTCGGEVFE